ncbi:mevalonate kinase [Streptomyces sp. NPDC127084]|uniref:mevalonate kinase n=1 Tax=Streptomyces sp. SpC080624SC-11 TaxID=663935 RepID=A0A068CLC5_9ACTN|nr:putative mevalonate kinase [Streptomyces sp. SpC080624SC-11]
MSALTSPTSAQGLPGEIGTRRIGIGRAHGKIILIGEHAVVYGAEALAVPLPQLPVTATVARLPGPDNRTGEVSFSVTSSVSGTVALQATDGLQRLVKEIKERAEVTDEAHIDVLVDCAIPLGRGLGSSAACARSIVLGLADLFDHELDESAIFELVQIAENIAHGRASGVDALATGAPAPIRFRGGTARELRVGFDGFLVIADSGAAGETKAAVELLLSAFVHDPGAQEDFVRRATELTGSAVSDLAHGRAEDFGSSLTSYHALLGSAGLSTERIDSLVDAALAAGSLGAKISGGGLGGCMIALAGGPAQARRIETRLQDAGATRTWIAPLGRSTDHAH